MSDDTQIANTGNNLPQPAQPQQPIQANLNQYGNDSTQIAYVQHYDATTNQTVLIMQGAQPAGGTVVGQGVTFNYDCFNFFVLGTEQYDGPTFMVPKNRALTESTSDEMKAQCAALTPEAIEIVKTFPALFCSENHNFTKTDPDHMAYYGYVTDIKVQDNGIKIYFTKLNALPQQVLIDLAAELCIGGAKAYNELSRTHWAIKRINLVEVLEKAGYRVFKL
jgi:hypothetical protein